MVVMGMAEGGAADGGGRAMALLRLSDLQLLLPETGSSAAAMMSGTSRGVGRLWHRARAKGRPEARTEQRKGGRAMQRRPTRGR